MARWNVRSERRRLMCVSVCVALRHVLEPGVADVYPAETTTNAGGLFGIAGPATASPRPWLCLASYVTNPIFPICTPSFNTNHAPHLPLPRRHYRPQGRSRCSRQARRRNIRQ